MANKNMTNGTFTGGAGGSSSPFPKCIGSFTNTEGSNGIDGSIIQNEDGSLVVLLEDGSTRPYDKTTDFPLGAPPSGIESSLTAGCAVYETVNGKRVFVGQNFVRETINEDGTGLTTTKLFNPVNTNAYVAFDGSQGSEWHDPSNQWDQLTVYCTDVSELNKLWDYKAWHRAGDTSLNVPEGSSSNLWDDRFGPDGSNGLPDTKFLDDYYAPDGCLIGENDFNGLIRIDDPKIAVINGVSANDIPAISATGLVYFPEPVRLAVSIGRWDAGRVYAACKTSENFQPVLEWNHPDIPEDLNNLGESVVSLPAGLYNIASYGADDQTAVSAGIQIYNDDGSVSPVEHYGNNDADVTCDEPRCAFICKETGEIRLDSIEGEVIELDNFLDGVIYKKEPTVCEIAAITPQSELITDSQVLSTAVAVDYTGVDTIAYIKVLSGPLAGTTITGGGPIPANSEYVIGYK